MLEVAGVRERACEAAIDRGVDPLQLLATMSNVSRSELHRVIHRVTHRPQIRPSSRPSDWPAELPRGSLITFIDEHCYHILGAKTLFADFHQRFTEWCRAVGVGVWTKRKVTREFPTQFPLGTHTGNKLFIGNLALVSGFLPSAPWQAVAGRLVRHRDQRRTLVQAVVALAESHGAGWSGSATNLLHVLEPILDPRERPVCPEVLSFKLNCLADEFQRVRVEVFQPRKRVWLVRRAQQSRSLKLVAA